MSKSSVKERDRGQPVVAKKNYAKRDAYALAFRMIEKAIACECPLQAITIEESILADRLWSTLNVGRPKRKLGTLNGALKEWKPSNGASPNRNACRFDAQMNKLYPRLASWWKDRNELLHGIAKSFQNEGPEYSVEVFVERARIAANEGRDLVKIVKRWSQQQIRAAKKNGGVK